MTFGKSRISYKIVEKILLLYWNCAIMCKIRYKVADMRHIMKK